MNETWKKWFFRSAGLGAGVVFSLCVLFLLLMWYESRPKPPKPWNTQAISAEFEYARAIGERDIAIYYTLQNNTDFDFKVQDEAVVKLAGMLKSEKSVSFEPEYLSGDFPVFVPAKGRSRFGIHLKYPYSEMFMSDWSQEERHDYGVRLAKFLSDKLGNLDGFAMFDESSRYRVEFPSGWRKVASEPLQVKAATKQ